MTTPKMTRFLITMDHAVDTIFAAYEFGRRGETLIPRVPSSLITNVASALINGRDIEIETVGIRPGEKVHEVLVAEDEVYRTTARDGYYVIHSILPELSATTLGSAAVLDREYSSANELMSLSETRAMLEKEHLTIEDDPDFAKLFA